MSTITTEQQAAIAAKLAGMTLPSGLGDEHNACSIAAINLALSGRLTDEIPDCMSEVVGRWIIGVQDSMPDEMRNSPRWKSLLPLAAGTGSEHEQERLAIIIDWMWSTVLPALQPLADAKGFSAAWSRMTTERTDEAAWAEAAEAAKAAAWAAEAAARAAAARAAARAAAAGAGWAAEAAEAAEAAAEALEAAWDQFDPCGLLERLVAVGEQK